MNSSVPHLFTLILPEDASGVTGLLAVVGIYLFLSWLVCVAAAFCNVREVQYRVGLLAMGASMLTAFLLVGLCRTFVPDLAASFTPSGLFLLAGVSSALACSVPVVQYFWNLSYKRGLTIVGGAVAIFLMMLVGMHLLLYPAKTLPARFEIPLFQDHQPGLIE